jgi:hypothetical protein
MINEPLFPLPEQPLPGATEHIGRTRYLSRVQAAQQRCEQLITAARTEYIQAEHDAWYDYQAVSVDAVRHVAPSPADTGNRWFTPPAGSHPYTESSD